jgi:YidC/Oxa1 family membrane protein insertase
MTPSRNGYEVDRVTRLQTVLTRLAPLLLLGAIVLIVAACVPATGGSTASGSAAASPVHSQAPLEPAKLGASPFDLLAWVFTPIFQALFIGLVVLDKLTGNMLIAILLLTVILRVITMPITRRQLVSSRQTQLLQPEIKELQRKYKGDRVKAQTATQEFYKQRGINPAGGCLPMVVTTGLLIPMYTVFSQGLTNYDITAMLRVGPIDFGQILGLTCPGAATGPVFDPVHGYVTNACLQSTSTIFGINWGIPEPYTTGLFVFGFGLSILAILSSLVQLVSSRQLLPPTDPRTADDTQIKTQRQMAYFLPFISILYGGVVPAGLMLYWIASSAIAVVQQFLVVGYGGIFPLFGWNPAFAQDYRPRYHVTLPEPTPTKPGAVAGAAERKKAVDRDLSARSTIRPNPNSRAKSGRRGRRR